MPQHPLPMQQPHPQLLCHRLHYRHRSRHHPMLVLLQLVRHRAKPSRLLAPRLVGRMLGRCLRQHDRARRRPWESFGQSQLTLPTLTTRHLLSMGVPVTPAETGAAVLLAREGQGLRRSRVQGCDRFLHDSPQGNQQVRLPHGTAAQQPQVRYKVWHRRQATTRAPGRLTHGPSAA